MEVMDKSVDGEEAILKYLNFIKKPDLILLDYRMPNKNGLEIMDAILKINSSALIIFISADLEIEKKALKKGAKRFLKKPIAGDTLISEIKSQLKII